MRALQFLRSEVHAVVDHSDPDEAASFRALLAHLLTAPSAPVPNQDGAEFRMDMTASEPRDSGSKDVFATRTGVFEALLEYVNPDAREPKTDLVDFVIRED